MSIFFLWRHKRTVFGLQRRPSRGDYGLPRRFAPRNDGGGAGCVSCHCEEGEARRGACPSGYNPHPPSLSSPRISNLESRISHPRLCHALPHADSRAGLSSAQAPDRLAFPYTGKLAPSAVPPLKSKAHALLLLRKKIGPPTPQGAFSCPSGNSPCRAAAATAAKPPSPLGKFRLCFLRPRRCKAAILESRISKLPHG